MLVTSKKASFNEHFVSKNLAVLLPMKKTSNSSHSSAIHVKTLVGKWWSGTWSVWWL
jgi:hypothetical protein